MHESEIIIHLTANDPAISNDGLEDHMFAVLAAVEEYADDAVEGVVVAVDFDKREIELVFSMCHKTQSEAQQIVANVFSLIETHTAVSFRAHDTAVRSQVGDEHSLMLCQ